MSQEVKIKLEWFLSNLDLQLEDLALEDQGINIGLYLDSADIRDSVLGMQAFYHSNNVFDRPMFYDVRSLVHCLATSGALGKIRMLPPHQAEFLTIMNYDFGLGVVQDYKSRARQFIDDIETLVHKKPDTNWTLEKISEDMSEEEMAELVDQVKQQAESAQTYFRALESFGPWQPRLARWLREETLQIEPEKFDFGSIVTSDEFSSLKEAFDSLRPRSNTMNNFADAVAVTILIRQVQAFLVKREAIPRFYVPSRLFLEAIKTADLLDVLTSDQGREDDSSRTREVPSSIMMDPKSVLRDSHYFVFKSLFRPKLKQPNVVKDSSSIKLRELQAVVSDILQTQSRLTDETIRSIEVSGRPLNEIIDEVRQFSFLRNIWLEFIEVDYVKRITNLQVQARDLVQWEQVKKALDITKNSIEDSAREYKQVKSLWNELAHSLADLKARRSELSRPVDVFRDLGLLRFGFPKHCHDAIKRIVEPIFGDDETEQLAARNAVIKAVYIREAVDRKHDQIDDLVQAAAVMWLVKLDSRLIKMLEESRRNHLFSHHSLKLVYAAAVFRDHQQIGRGRQVVDELIQEYKRLSPHDYQTRADLAAGIAYLFFHLWWCLGYWPTWFPRSDTTKKRGRTEEGQKLINHAVEYAKHAADAAGQNYLLKRAYALNQYAYYMIMGGGEDRVEEIENAVAYLLRYKTNRDLWQFRFDDTLARYFHRLATKASTEVEWRALMGKSGRYLEEARKFAHGDEDVEFYGAIFDFDMTLGFKRRGSK